MHFEALGTLVLFTVFTVVAVIVDLVVATFLTLEGVAFTNLLLQLLLVQLPLIIIEPHLQNSAILFIPSVSSEIILYHKMSIIITLIKETFMQNSGLRYLLTLKLTFSMMGLMKECRLWSSYGT
jgi:hypothetical protein